jgi:hypothetical protein
MTTLADIEQRAQRMLDGMTVNREAFARDVLALVAAVRAARPASEPQHSGFAEAFDDILGEAFGGKRRRPGAPGSR